MNYIAVSKWEQRPISLKCGDTFTATNDDEIRAFRAVYDGSCRECCFHTGGSHCLVQNYPNIDCSGTTHFIKIDPNAIVEELI